MSAKNSSVQKQEWVHHGESMEKSTDVIRQTNIGLLVAPTILGVVIGLVARQYLIAPLLGIVLGVLAYRMVSSAARSAFDLVHSSTLANETEHARLFNVVDGLCVVSGDQRPLLYIIDGSYPTACAAIDENGDAIIGVTNAFVNSMTRVEVESVMAHLLWRIRVGHPQTIAYFFGLQKVMKMVGLGSLAQRRFTSVMAPEVINFADIASCQATRFPPAVISALEKCESADGSVDCGLADSLSFALPSERSGDTNGSRNVSNLGVSRPLLSQRIAVLKEL